MARVVVVGGGWAGCGAAIGAARQGAEVVLLERTDMLLGTGLAGGLYRNNGRYTAAEEIKFMGCGDLIDAMDEAARHHNVEIPDHKHGSIYDAHKMEPSVKRKLAAYPNLKVLLEARAQDVRMKNGRIEAIITEDKEVIEGDVFIDTTGTTGSQANCTRYGNGCSMCILRCPTFGNRVSVAAKAGVKEMMAVRPGGGFGAFSGACEIGKDTVARHLVDELEAKGSLVVPLPLELQDENKLRIKACQQYATPPYYQNLVIIDNGYVKIIAPFLPLKKLRAVPGFEEARYEDPYSGGIGNSIRFLAVAPRDNTLKVTGVENLYCGGEKAGFYVGHTEAAVTGALAGHNAARQAAGGKPIELPRTTALGEFIAHFNEVIDKDSEGLSKKFTFAGSYFLKRMEEKGLYSIDHDTIEHWVEESGTKGILA